SCLILTQDDPLRLALQPFAFRATADHIQQIVGFDLCSLPAQSFCNLDAHLPACSLHSRTGASELASLHDLIAQPDGGGFAEAGVEYAFQVRDFSEQLNMHGEPALFAESRSLQHIEHRRMCTQSVQRNCKVFGRLVVHFELDLRNFVAAMAFPGLVEGKHAQDIADTRKCSRTETDGGAQVPACNRDAEESRRL